MVIITQQQTPTLVGETQPPARQQQARLAQHADVSARAQEGIEQIEIGMAVDEVLFSAGTQGLEVGLTPGTVSRAPVGLDGRYFRIENALSATFAPCSPVKFRGGRPPFTAIGPAGPIRIQRTRRSISSKRAVVFPKPRAADALRSIVGGGGSDAFLGEHCLRN